ncbi:MAG: DUF4982 domain-containing protein [Candidatus Cryptobacteroides sp.]
MKKILPALFLFVSVSLSAQKIEHYILEDWTFHRGSLQSEGVPVCIPHDWAISGPFDKEIDKQTVAIEQNGELAATEKTGRSGALPWIGEGWYEREIIIPEGYPHVELVFHGAMSEPVVYLDGVEVGSWAYGYTTFVLDISKWANAGRHRLCVHLRNVEESSRWYPGAGLYRPVQLRMGQEVGFRSFGLFARTLEASEESAKIGVATSLRAPGPVEGLRIRHRLLDNEGCEQVCAEESAGTENDCTLLLSNPRLWSPEEPYLYTLVSELWRGGTLLDREETRLGVRTLSFSADGFKLNGELRKIKGVCLHHDLGPLGAAFNCSAFRRQVSLLKDIGCDAIRVAHNIPEPWQLDICDEMGMMVMAESVDMWIYPKCANGYSRFFEDWWQRDFTNLVEVNRNHPSVIMWSIGNEIPEQGSPLGPGISADIQQLVHTLDPTRPCTQGMDRVRDAIRTGVFRTMDVPGCNYRLHYYREALEASPGGFILGSETASTVSSRGVYKFPAVENHTHTFDDGQVSSYDLQSCVWSNLPDDDFMWQDKAPWVIGEFVWTGFDYLGEPTPYDEYWPSRSSYFGMFDLAGLPKDRAYLYRVHWAPEKETLHILPHWTWPGREGETTPVFCYTSYPEAELFINGKSQGRRRRVDMSLDEYEATLDYVPTPWGDSTRFLAAGVKEEDNRLNRYRLRWMDAVYEPGEIKIVAYDAAGNVAAQKTVRTAGRPHHIELLADRLSLPVLSRDSSGFRNSTPELAFIRVRVVDKDGNLCPSADNQLSFSVKGKSLRFNSCCNGDATSTEVFTEPTMKAFNGELVLVVEAGDTPGKALVKVSSPGLRPATLQISCR